MLLYALEPFIDYGLESIESSDYKEWKNILDGNINADVIVMGSSRGKVSYDTEILEQGLGLKVYNLSFDGGSYNLQNIKLKAYLKHNKKPKLIIQNIDIVHFQTSKILINDRQIITHLKDPYIQAICRETTSDLLKYRYFGVTKYTTDSRFYKESLKAYLGFKSPYNAQNGTIMRDRFFKEDTHNLEASKKSKNQINTKILESGIDQTLSFYKQLSEDSIAVCFVWALEYKTRITYGTYKSAYIKEKIQMGLDKVKNFKFIDLQKDPISDYKNNFYDTFHLNRTGATAFSFALNNELQEFKHVF